MDKFVLIGGMPRSGTTLLETVIGSHPMISVPPGDIPFAEHSVKGLSVERIFERLSGKATWSFWAEQDFSAAKALPPGEAFVAAMARYADSTGKSIPAAKSPFNEFFYDTYRDWLGDFDLKFIHVVRNPFDVMASLKKSHIHRNWQAFSDMLDTQSRNWARSVRLGAIRASRNPDRYSVLCYEDFVDDPVAGAEALCRFIGVPADTDRMLSRGDYDYHSTNTSFPDAETKMQGKARDIYRAESRKDFLSRSEIELVAGHCGEAACAMGYEDPDFKVSEPFQPEQLNNVTLFKRRISRIRRKVLGSPSAT